MKNPIVWLGLSFDNPYFSSTILEKYVTYVTNLGFPFSVHLTDTLLPFSLKAKLPSLTNAEIKNRVEKIVSDSERMLLKMRIHSQKDFEIVKWSHLLANDKRLGALSTWALNEINENIDLSSSLEVRAIDFLNKCTLSNKTISQIAVNESKKYLWLETVVSSYLREHTVYSIEVTPYGSIGIVNQLYSNPKLNLLRKIVLTSNVKEPKIYHLKFTS
ncbi:MAG: hypothetical protein KDD40_11785 [Bdellovibrionales bacterium]|nr:hypothetical protein [Bdellovibrionales bacterium]